MTSVFESASFVLVQVEKTYFVASQMEVGLKVMGFGQEEEVEPLNEECAQVKESDVVVAIAEV